jgi:MFS transporter, ACS family, tartrate transporter
MSLNAPGSPNELAQRAVRRVAGRLTPFLLLLYVVAYLDRVNVGYAKLRMTDDLGWNEAVFGLGTGLFFIGYFLFEIPGTILVESWSARKWFARIMLSWGLCAAACGFIHSRGAFYSLRLLLGACEAGFAPGVVVYLTHWYPRVQRGRAMALFLIGIPLAGVIGAPLSGWLLPVHWWGLAGWRWVFIAEGLPAVLLGVATYFFLTDRPRDAGWLPPTERQWLEAELAREEPATATPHGFQDALAGLGRLIPNVLAHAPVRLLMATYFFGLTAHYGLTIWLPAVIKDSAKLSDQRVTLLVAIAHFTALVAMLACGWHSDRTGERRWHTTGPVWAGALGMVGVILFRDRLVLAMPFFCLAAAGLTTFISGLWALTSSRVGGRPGAVAVGLINSMGNLGGFAGPYALGYLKYETKSYTAGLIYLVIAAVLAGALVLWVDLEQLATVRSMPSLLDEKSKLGSRE